VVGAAFFGVVPVGNEKCTCYATSRIAIARVYGVFVFRVDVPVLKN